MALDFFVQADTRANLRRVETLLGCGIFNVANTAHPLLFAALTELLILVRDLLAKAKIHSRGVNFSDDVRAVGDVTDVHSLIKFGRDTVCHRDSKNHNYAEARISFNVVAGRGCLAEINGFRLESEYEDDVAFFFGGQRIYLQRHIVRAYQEAKAQLEPLLDERLRQRGRARRSHSGHTDPRNAQ